MIVEITTYSGVITTLVNLHRSQCIGVYLELTCMVTCACTCVHNFYGQTMMCHESSCTV